MGLIVLREFGKARDWPQGSFVPSEYSLKLDQSCLISVVTESKQFLISIVNRLVYVYMEQPYSLVNTVSVQWDTDIMNSISARASFVENPINMSQ